MRDRQRTDRVSTHAVQSGGPWLVFEPVFDFHEGMMVVADPRPYEEHARPVMPNYPYVDLTLIQLVVEHAAETADEGPQVEAELIDRIAQLESLQHSLAALQSATVHTLARAHAAAQTASGTVEPEKLHRSIASQVALACGVSPTEGRKRVRVARDLRNGLDGVRGLPTTGELSAHKAATVVTATADLDADERAEVDRRLADQHPERLGVGRLRDLARSLAAQVAPEKFRARRRSMSRSRSSSRSRPCSTRAAPCPRPFPGTGPSRRTCWPPPPAAARGGV